MRFRTHVLALLAAFAICAAVPGEARAVQSVQEVVSAAAGTDSNGDGAIRLILADPAPPSNTIGAANGTGVVATEYGNRVIHQTVLTLTAVSITVTDATTAGAHGALKVYDFPAGPITILGCTTNLTTLAGAGGIADGAALVSSLGSATVATDNATLVGSGEGDVVASYAGTLTSGAGVVTKHGSLVATAFDGHTTPMDLYMNFAVPDADSSASDTLTVAGTIKCTWTNSGDY